jgi:four helix bundle protein
MEVKSHKDLIVWQKAMDLAAGIYTLVEALPVKETYGLWSQLTRAASCVPANIAEGKGKNNDREFKRYLGIALGSQAELECLATLAGDLNFLDPKTSAELEQAAKDVGSLMAALRRRL